jgi:3-phosphoshikimate 1-carboxyvinyltransferase
MNLKNSLYKVYPGPVHLKIEIPKSKSHANRALIIGAIRGGGFKVNFIPESTDVLTLLACLEKIGLKIIRVGSCVSFMNSFPQCEKDSSDQIIDLKTGDGGTTNRFLLALLSRGKKTYRLFPSEKMSERPMDDLLNPLRKLNVKLSTQSNGAWIEVQGPAEMLQSTKLSVDCSVSTQFASAMMLAFSTVPLQIVCENIKASETYIEMTKFILRESLNKNSLDVPADFSSLSYPLALGLVNGEVLITNCRKPDPYQADAKFIEIAQNAGADIEWTAEGLRASSQKRLKPLLVDGSTYPDLVPSLIFLAAHIDGESVLTNLSVLRHKESDRLDEIMKMLKVMSIPFQFDESRAEIKIQGSSQRKYSSLTISPERDHRMVMTAFMFLKAGAGGMLGETDCVNKSFPQFFELMNGEIR